MPDWKAGEGQVLDGKYPLERFARGDPETALFLTASGSSAVRVCRVPDPARAIELLGRWNRAKRFPHANLIRIEEAGTADLAGVPVGYLVMEHAEENLDDVLRDRALTPDEARAMLLPVAAALDYLHRRGMAHHAVKPSHIFAIGDTVKLSSESIAEGDPSADIQALGETLTAALGVTPLPPPFDRIAAGCLDPHPARRWTADKVVSVLQSSGVATTPPPPARRRLVAPVALGAVAVGVVSGIMLYRTETPLPATTAEPRPAPVAASLTTPPAPKSTVEGAQSSRDRIVMEDGVAHRVVPDVPKKARDTITGKPVVVVRVTADPGGNVTDAAVERTFSPYFSNLALDAARQWKFASSQDAGPRQWTLRFRFTPANTTVSAARAGAPK